MVLSNLSVVIRALLMVSRWSASGSSRLELPCDGGGQGRLERGASSTSAEGFQQQPHLLLGAAGGAFCCFVVPRLSGCCSRGGHCWFLVFGAVLAASGGEWTRFAVVDGGDRCGEDVLWRVC